jgi:zinc-binding alcohol dehydrogenase/oxidoreductase
LEIFARQLTFISKKNCCLSKYAAKMNALVLNKLHQGLDYQQVTLRNPMRGEVIVELKAAALNHRDVYITEGLYAGIKFPTILGSDGAGELNGRKVIINPSINWGKNPRTQGENYKILGLPDDGTFAEAIVISKKQVFDQPSHLTFSEAAALPLAGLTAFRALFSKIQLKKGEKLLISGIGGGVALMALQLAIAAGAEVFVTSGSDEKIGKAIKMGAKTGFNYSEIGWEKRFLKEIGRVSAVLDSAGGDGFAGLIGLLDAGGRAATFGGTRGKINGLSPQLIFWKQISIFGTSMGTDSEFQKMLKFVEKQEICPVVDAKFNLANGNNALQKMALGDQFGKLVLEI